MRWNLQTFWFVRNNCSFKQQHDHMQTTVEKNNMLQWNIPLCMQLNLRLPQSNKWTNVKHRLSINSERDLCADDDIAGDSFDSFDVNVSLSQWLLNSWCIVMKKRQTCGQMLEITNFHKQIWFCSTSQLHKPPASVCCIGMFDKMTLSKVSGVVICQMLI